MHIYVISAFFIFRKLLFGDQYMRKKIRKKFGQRKRWSGVVWGGEGSWIDETGYNVLPFLNMLNVSLHCFD